MNIVRNEIRTGLLVVVTMAALAAVLIYLAAPGMLRKMNYYQIYFDDAGGIQIGAPVMLSGRRIGQVARLRSPVPEAERPRPNLEAVVEVEVSAGTRIFRHAKVSMLQYGLLGEQVINFMGGSESAGIATAQTKFIGERQPGLNEAAPMLIEKLEPVAKSATRAMDEFYKTAKQLTALTDEAGDLASALTNFKALGDNLVELSGTEGALRQTMENLQTLTGEGGPLAQTLQSARQFTSGLANNGDIGASLENFRKASQNLNRTLVGLHGTVRSIGPGVKETVHNAAQFTDTVKHQPWRLIWPTTKKYPEDQARVMPEAIAERRGGRRGPSPTPAPGKCQAHGR